MHGQSPKYLEIEKNMWIINPWAKKKLIFGTNNENTANIFGGDTIKPCLEGHIQL